MAPVADSLSWTTFGLAVGGAGLAALLLVSLVVLLVRRRPSRTSLELMLTQSSSRVETMLSELTTALDDAQTETERSRQLAEIGSTIDLDEVVARTLEASGALLGVEAAMLILDARNGSVPSFVATVGLRPEEADHASGPRTPDWKRTRATLVTYLYTDVEVDPNENGSAQPLRGAAAVPVRGETDDLLGTLWAFWRTAEPIREEQVALLEELALRAGPAIENARRFQEARQLADMDALTGLHNYRFFHETLAREVARAHRYDRRLALVVIDVDDFKAVNDRVGHLAGDSVLAGAGQRVLSAVRSADIACRVGGDEFAVILPESTRSDAEALYERLESGMTRHPAGAAQLRLSAGIAELRADDDAVTFFKRADEALYRAKALGKGQAIESSSQAGADAA
jgi:diguanylate cyclase (GGDEF)-like protein